MPFFVMANLVNTHYPWTPPLDILLRHFRLNPKYLLKSEFSVPAPWQFNSGRQSVTAVHRRVWRSLYDGAIMHVDRELGRFLRRLQQWPGWQDLSVIITSDHGEMLGDYRDCVGHMLSLHDNITHVPLVVRHPDYPSGVVVEGVVQTVDLYSSAAEWASMPRGSVPVAQLQRPSYSQAVGSPDSAGGYAFAEEDYTDSYHVLEGLVSTNPLMEPHKYPRRQIAVRSATHKYIWCDDRVGEFYDLVNDPIESQNLLLQNKPPTELAELRGALEEWRSALELFPPQTIETPDELDGDVRSRLRALGYIS